MPNFVQHRSAYLDSELDLGQSKGNMRLAKDCYLVGHYPPVIARPVR